MRPLPRLTQAAPRRQQIHQSHSLDLLERIRNERIHTGPRRFVALWIPNLKPIKHAVQNRFVLDPHPRCKCIRQTNPPRLVQLHPVRFFSQNSPQGLSLRIGERHRRYLLNEFRKSFGRQHQQARVRFFLMRPENEGELNPLIRRAPLRWNLNASLLIHPVAIARLVNRLDKCVRHSCIARRKSRDSLSLAPPQRPTFYYQRPTPSTPNSTLMEKVVGQLFTTQDWSGADG